MEGGGMKRALIAVVVSTLGSLAAMKGRTRLSLAAAVLVALPIGIGCESDGVACTLIGCANRTIEVRLRPDRIVDKRSEVAARLCVDGRCETVEGRLRRGFFEEGHFSVGLFGEDEVELALDLGDDATGQEREVEGWVRFGDGAPVTFSGEVMMEASYPNGKRCNTCWHGELDLT
jgi:hypothetical protein